MPLLDLLTESSALRLCQSPDIDRFRRIENLSEAQSIPLDLSQFDTAFAEVALKSCSVFLQRTFPRILQANYRTSGAILAFAMDDAGVAVVNGGPGTDDISPVRLSSLRCRGAARQRDCLYQFC